MFTKIKAAIAAFQARADVQSTERHAFFTGFGVVSAAVAVGGVHSVTTGVAIAAFSAAARVIEMAVVAKVKG